MKNNIQFNNIFKINSFEKDALKELSNIGFCYSLTSLSEITGESYEISIPEVKTVQLKDMYKGIDMERIVAGVMLEFEGDLSGHMQFLFPDYSAYLLIDKLLMNELGTTTKITSEIEKSILKEIGNILSSAFCDAFAKFFDITVIPLPPYFAFDMIGSLIEESIVLMSRKEISDNVLLFKCGFRSELSSICGFTLLYPDNASFEDMVSMLKAKIETT